MDGVSLTEVMNYKAIFKSKALRFKILKALSFVPDRVMLSIQYWIKFGRLPNLRNPKKFTEKIQLYKMLYRNPLLPVCADKYRVREYIKSKGLEDILVKLYGMYTKGEEIPFDSLPDKFVLKTNDGSGGNNVIICTDKSKLDIEETVKKLNSWLNVKEIDAGREWAYTGIPESVILAEEYLEKEENPESGLEDYKIFCFHGKPYMIQYDSGRFTSHQRNFYDLEWKPLDIQCTYPNMTRDVVKPAGLKDMLKMAEILSKDFPFVRVDLYYVNNSIKFSELTFYPGSGYEQFVPDIHDEILGSLLKID